jgi:D-apiose dehydrogenase
MDTVHHPLKIAVIGAGFFSQFHLDGWRGIPAAQVTVLCDTDNNRLRALGERYQIPHLTTRISDVAQHGVDIIDVVTPPASHVELVEQLLPLKKIIICQKPFTPSTAEAERLTQRAESAGVPLVIHENFRFAPWFREIKRLIDADFFGTLHTVSFRLRPGDGQGPQAYLDRQPYFQKMPKFLVRETAIHFVDTFRFLCGEVRSVTAKLRRANPVIAGEDAGYLFFDFCNGATGLFDGNRLNEHPAQNLRRTMGEAWIEGSKGVMRLDGEARLWWLPHAGGHNGEEKLHQYNSGPLTFAGGACGALCAHVAAHVRTGSALENTARAYLRNIAIQDAIYLSHETGRTIHLPVDSTTPC